MARLLAVLIFFLCVVGCTSTASHFVVANTSITTEQLLSGAALFGNESATIEFPEDNILADNKEMRSFLNAVLVNTGSKAYRVRVLASSLIDPGLFGFKYVGDQSNTAADTFSLRQGNCMSFTNLFISLARSAGLNAYYQEVLVTPEWEQDDGYMVMRGHINAVVELHGGRSMTVDVGNTPQVRQFNHKRIADRKGFALFYSNIGVKYLQAGNTIEAFRYLKRAVTADSNLGSSWVNLGALYSRRGAVDYAEAAYLEAVRRDPDELLSYSNLAKIYRAMGRQEEADIYAQKASRLRKGNPYYHYGLAQAAHKQGDYRKSNSYLERAINLKKNEPIFHELLQKNSGLLSKDSGQQAQFSNDPVMPIPRG